MTLERPSAFTESPEELLARASTWTVEMQSSLDNALLIRDLAKALEKERVDRARTFSVHKAMNLEYAVLEGRVRRLSLTRATALALTAVNVLVAAAVWGHALGWY